MEIEIVEVLIHKALSKNISASEQNRLTNWLNENEANRQTYEEISAIWKLSQMEEVDYIPVNVADGLAKLHTSIDIASPQTVQETKVVNIAGNAPAKSFPWMKIAAGFLVLIGLFMVAKVFSPNAENQFVEHTNQGEINTLDMADGSTILMNEASEVTFYPHIKSERRLTLKGEAFFDVARDESKPFIIETSNAFIEVLGTSFNVNSSEEGATSVAVRSGKVQVSLKNGSAAKVLTAGQSIMLKESFEELTVAEKVELEGYQGLLDFKSTKLEEVFSNLQLKFGTRFQWNINALKNCELTGALDDNSLEEIMAILKTVFQIEEITITEKQVTLIGGKCK